jgi:phosphoribosylaminoimidazolecarboxamide formyltransferase/IMP cyclohydrolase
VQIMTQRALLSVYDKTGLEGFARGLQQLGFELVASGNTSRALGEAGIDHVTVESVTGAPEMLGGRVKTLHPKIHGGILADRSKPEHLADLEKQDIATFDLVACNLYPFRSDPSIELIDVGGPTMVRAAAKNHAHVAVLVDPSDYGPVLDELRREGSVTEATRRRLARAAFAHTAAYDAAITTWFDESAPEPESLPPTIHLALERTEEQLRYGENPHQSGARYREIGRRSWWDDVVQHFGMGLSYLNLFDAAAAWELVHDLGDGPAAAIIKHANPCGAAVAGDLATAYRLAFECDEKSAFGGIVAVNRPVDTATAEEMVKAAQADLVIAPGYEPGTVDMLRAKRKNTRVLEAPAPQEDRFHIRQINGAWLVQDPHHFASTRADWRVATKTQPTEEQWRDLELAWRLVGHVKSNAIILVAGGQAVGIGAGQQSRVDTAEIAAKKAAGRAKGGASASDAFYPFADGVDAAIAAGVGAMIQPGGSLRDDEVVAAADAAGIAMVMTGERHFLH